MHYSYCKSLLCTTLQNIMCGNPSWGVGYWEISMLKFMLVNKDFQTGQHSRQPIRSHVKNHC